MSMTVGSQKCGRQEAGDSLASLSGDNVVKKIKVIGAGDSLAPLFGDTVVKYIWTNIILLPACKNSSIRVWDPQVICWAPGPFLLRT